MKPAIRQKTNIIIDIAMFVLMLLVAILGIIIRYILIPGSERWIKYGRNVELTVLGIDRHDWGLIHLIVGMILVGLLVLHLILHWTQIVFMVKKLIPNAIFRTTIVTFLLMLSLTIVVLPLYIPLEIGDNITGHGQGLDRNREPHSQGISQTLVYDKVSQKELTMEEKLSQSKQEKNIAQPEELNVETVKPEEQHSGEEHTLNIRGYHTFSELAVEYNISTKKLKESLGIPATISNNERLGRVRRTYNFTMSDVEEAILKLQGS